MKLRINSALLSLVAAGFLGAAPAADETNIGTITTSWGRTYRDCRVCQIDPDGVTIAHQRGIAKLLFGELPASIRTKLGYDPQRELEYNKDRAETKRRAQELKVELQKEVIKAQASIAVAEIQAGSAMAAAGYVPPAAPWAGCGLTGGLYGWDGSLYNAGYPGAGWNGAGAWGGDWNNRCYGRENISVFRNNAAACRGPILNVYTKNGCGWPSPLALPRPAANLTVVPPLRGVTPPLGAPSGPRP